MFKVLLNVMESHVSLLVWLQMLMVKYDVKWLIIPLHSIWNKYSLIPWKIFVVTSVSVVKTLNQKFHIVSLLDGNFYPVKSLESALLEIKRLQVYKWG